MSISTATRQDPFVTSLELAAEAAGFRSGAAFNRAYDAVVWGLLTPAEQAEMYEYGEAGAENFRWTLLVERQKSATRMTYTDAAGWHFVPYSDDEKAAERRAFQRRER